MNRQEQEQEFEDNAARGLCRLLSDEQPSVREDAIEIAEDFLGDERVVKVLQKIADGDPHLLLRMAARAVLGSRS